MYPKSLKNDVVSLGNGLNSEFTCIKVNTYSPPLVIFSYYGPQSYRGADYIYDSIRELFNEVKLHLAEATVVITGDFNLHIGNNVVRDNEPNISKYGQLFLQFVEECKLSIMNNMTSGKTYTYIDPVHNTKRALDLIVTNSPQVFSELSIDTHHREGIPMFTPFSVKTERNIETKTFADHAPIMFKLTLEINQNIDHKPEKIRVWRYNRKDGVKRYKKLTNDRAHILIDQLSSIDDPEEAVKAFDKFIYKCKKQAYDIRTISRSKFKRIKSKAAWKKRAEIVNEMYKQACETGRALRTFKLKELIDSKLEEKGLSAAYDYRTGQRLEDLVSICDMFLDYNYDNLQKAPTPEHLSEVYELKKAFIEDQWNAIDPAKRVITWKQFMKAVYKIFQKRKSVYLDFINSGNDFKVAVFHLVNKIYQSGKIPESFHYTKLTKIYKKKGSVNEVTNYRFIHSKPWIAKLMEKIIVYQIDHQIKSSMPELQVGGIKGLGARDHILTTIATMRSTNMSKKPVCALLIDVSRCFDKVKNEDLIYETLKIGCKPEALKFIHDMSAVTHISMSNMGNDKATRTVYDTAGQGQDFACLGTGFAIGNSLHTRLGPGQYPDSVKVGKVKVPPRAYVDDAKVMSGNPRQLRSAGHKVSDAFDDLSLQINPKKTKILVIGTGAKARKMRDDLKSNPVIIQGHEISIADQDTYLGMKISQAGVLDSISKTFEERKANAWNKLYSFKKMLRHPAMQMNGFIKSAVTLFRATIIPTLLYSCESWYGLTKKTLKYIEKTYKKMIYSLLDIPVSTNYLAVLHELGLKQAKHIIAAQKINMINHVAISGHRNMTYQVLAEDLRIHKSNSILAEVKDLCLEYGMQSVWEYPSDSDTIKAKINERNDVQQWKAIFISSITVTRLEISTEYKPYHFADRIRGRAILLWRCGALRFKSLWNKGFSGKNCCLCPHRLCGEIDNFKHAIKCPFMKTKLSKDQSIPYEQRVGDFIIKLNLERFNWHQATIM